MPHTAGRVLRATTTAVVLAATLAGCASEAPTEPAGAAPTTASPAASSPPPATATPNVVAPKTQRPADPPRSAQPQPCDGVTRSGGTGPKRLEPHTTGLLLAVRAERKTCTDAVAFRVGGTARFGAYVQYVAKARAARSGDPIELRGGAVLEVVVLAPDYDHAAGRVPPGRAQWRIGEEVARVPSGAPALREVAYAGPNDGSETVFVLGVRERLPFTVAWRAGDGFSELTVEVAHQPRGK